MPSSFTRLADVIALVVGNSPELDSPRDLCSLLLVDSRCRQSLQEQEVWGHMRVTQSTHSRWDKRQDHADGTFDLSALTNFARWLPRHSGLVSHIALNARQLQTTYDRTEWLLVQQHVTLALQSCRLSAEANSTALQPLRLQKCCISGPLQDPLLLRELEAARLQELDLKGTPPIAVSTLSACTSALARMTSLKSLKLSRYIDAAQLPPSLHHLDIRSFPSSQSSGDEGESSDGDNRDAYSFGLDLQHLTALKTLTLWECSTATLQLPPVLSRMELWHCTVQQVTGGVRLLDLKVVVYPGGELSTVAAISRLPRIQKLEIYWYLGAVARQPVVTAQQAAAALGLASSLTSLWLDGPDNCDEDVFWCRSLSQLPQLQELTLHQTRVPRDDLRHLSSLTTLTRLLVVENTLDTSVASALAAKLTRLQFLGLQSDQLTSAGLLSVVGAALTGLVELRLRGGNRFEPDDSDLMLLSSLTQLTALDLNPHACTEEGRDELLAGMPHLVELALSGLEFWYS